MKRITQWSALQQILLLFVVLVGISPIGVYLPDWFGATNAWGEWDLETVSRDVGYEPQGMKRQTELWQAPVGNYGQSDAEASRLGRGVRYAASALLGAGVCVLMGIGLDRLLRGRRRQELVNETVGSQN